MSDELTHLSLIAHDQALMRGNLTPAERPEWNHLPMRLIRGVPVFDGSERPFGDEGEFKRMRDDQIEEVVYSLGKIVDRLKVRYGTVRDQVEQYMSVYGHTGARLQDIIESTGASKPILLKYLREMVDEGKVKIEEEQTRGKKASRRKRYFLVEERNYLPTITKEDQEFMSRESLAPQSLGLDKNDSSGIIYHGAWTHSVVCPCNRCRQAFTQACIADSVSAARKRGETGFKEMMAQI